MTKLAIYAFVFCQSLLVTFASDLNAQRKYLHEIVIDLPQYQNADLKDLIDDIQERTDFEFAFPSTLINGKTVTIEERVWNMEDLLKVISIQARVSIHRVNEIISFSEVYSQTLPNVVEMKTPDLIITGTVMDENGESLPGATVLEKGTSNGTITAADGTFSLQVSDENAILSISFVGYTTTEIQLNGRTVLEISLESDITALAEVVVIGYGTVKKSDMTGSVVSADFESFSESPNVSVAQSLQGSVAGLSVSQTTRAGEDPVLTIRGTSSISGSQAPLIVVDGIIYRGSLNDINPNDIKSIDVLKDASSAAIYGSQGANGVIVVTSKKGVGKGKPVMGYSTSYSFQSPTKVLRPSNYEEFVQKNTDLDWRSNSLAPEYIEPDRSYVNTNFLNSAAKEGWDNGVDTDWWGLLTVDNPRIINHNLNLRGSSEFTDYFLSAGFADQQNLVVNDTYKRYNFRLNLDHSVTDWLNIGVKSFLTTSDFSGASPDMRLIHILAPIARAYDDNGEVIVEPYWGGFISPLLHEKIDDLDKRVNLDGIFYTEIQIPWVEGLSYKLNTSLKTTTNKKYSFNPYGANYEGKASKYNAFQRNWTVDNIITYNREFSNVHNVNVILLYGRENRTQEETLASASGFANHALGYNAIEVGDATRREIASGAWEENSLYSMARLFYGYDSKYLITGTVRRDGFSGFGQNNKYGIFPSLALAWVASNERFFQDNFSQVDNLKIRASYGVSGNRTVGRYQTLSPVKSSISYLYGDGGNPVLGQSVDALPNPDLKWEKTTGFNLGVDFSLFSYRISGTVEYYNNKTNDLLYNINIPSVNGFTSVPTNIGELNNTGVELILSGQPVNKGSFQWNVTANFSLNRNKVVTILGRDNNGDGVEDDLVGSGIFIGEPLGVWYDYERTGMWQLADEADNIIPTGFLVGTPKIADLNNDGSFTAEGDRKILGYLDPSYRFGIQNTINYKGFSLMVFINSIQGGKNRYYGNIDIQERGWREGDNAFNYANPGWDWWTPANPDAIYPRIDARGSFEPTIHMQRNFVRLQDITLSYTFNSELLAKVKISNLKVYVAGKNLATWTKWRGWDPETGIGYQSNAVPVMKSVTTGLSFEF